MYLRTKNEVFKSRLSKVRARTGQTDRQREKQTHTYTHREMRPNSLPPAFAVIFHLKGSF